MKTSKKVISLVLTAIMIMTTFVVAVPSFLVEADAAITIGGITQQRVVEADGGYATTYNGYASDFLNGSSEPTNVVIPGLSQSDYFVVQGLSYYKPQDWFMVSVYHTTGGKPSMLFALDAATGNFEAVFAIYNVGNTGVSSPNYDHGGGLAFSDYNFYYSGDDSDVDEEDASDGNADRIAYASLSQFENPVDSNNDGIYEITLEGEVDLYEMNGAATAYVCYDEGILWAGNFYEDGVGAGDYNKAVITTPTLYNSMIYGYDLQGSSSLEEWQYLTGAMGNVTDCAGAPSHCIAIHTDIEDIQYAIVDDGKLYLSRSWGTGKNDSGFITDIGGSIGGTLDYSILTVADIDLSVGGDVSITHPTSTGTRTTSAHLIDEYKNYDMMPMSEGLCFVDDYLYISFEGASYKYMYECDAVGKTGNCDYPIDVVWKVDPYILSGDGRPVAENTLYYEEVNSLTEIKNGEQYIIAYQSSERDPVTQNPILYALNCDDGLKDYRLSKRNSSNTSGYVGAVGYPITSYSLEDGKLYLANEAEDDIETIRWTISGVDTSGTVDSVAKISNASLYFSEYDTFYFDKNGIAMANSSVTNNVHLYETGSGGFYIYSPEQMDYSSVFGASMPIYLWCNDGNSGYDATVNSWYTNNSGTAMYNGITETAGTFHPNALGDNNIIGGAIDGASVGDFTHGTFRVFKRVIDDFASTTDSRVYTDMEAELQADGTYNVMLETYATGEVQYQMLKNERPTDFIFVLDASGSMSKADATGYENHTQFDLEAASGTTEDASAVTSNSTNSSETATYAGTMYILHGEEYCQINVKVQGDGREYKFPSYHYYQKVYLSYTVPSTGQTYWFHPTSSDKLSGYWDTTVTTYDEALRIGGASKDARDNTLVYKGGVTHQFRQGEARRIDVLKNAVRSLSYKINQSINETGLDHRIAVVQYGSDSSGSWNNTGLYTKDSTTMVPYTGAGTISTAKYQNVFHNQSEFDNVRAAVDSIDATTGADTYSNYGFDMANDIIKNTLDSNGYVQNYRADGDRNVAIIMFTDGVPGVGGDDYESANKTADAAIAESYIAKCDGAYVYTVQMGNNSMDKFSMNLYMDAVSSEYVTARSTALLGERNPSDINYHLDIDIASTDGFQLLVSSVYDSIQLNSKSGLAVLTEESILRERLSDAFLSTSYSKITYEYVDGNVDAIGRITFEEDNPVTATDISGQTQDKNGDGFLDTVLVTGYDYSDEYIGYQHSGSKLKVTISGLVANPDKKITNTYINHTEDTAIYQDATWLNIEHAFKHFPNSYFTIPEYTYVLDYGLQMYDDAVNGTLLAVNDAPAKLIIADYQAKLPYTQASENGLVKITNNNLDLIYTTTPTNFADSGYCFIQRDNGKYDWFSIKVIPASNVLFEEGYAVNGTAGSVDWSAEGTATNVYQSLANDDTDVYGYDEVYATTDNGHSNGTVSKVNLSSSSKRSTTKNFTFIGEGFDLISACGKNTGILAVSVKNADGELVKGYVVDTYYGDTNVVNADGLACQIPVVKFSGDHGTYTVETTALYISSATALKKSVTGKTANGKLSGTTASATADAKALLAELGMTELANADLELVWFDNNSVLNGGTGAKGNTKTSRDGTTTKTLDCYIDGFRIYYPMSTEEVDYIEKEQDAVYHNVLGCINENHIGTGTTSLDGIAYVETAVGEGETLTFANYESFGPQNEFYLKANGTDALVLKVSLPTRTSRVHLGLRAVTGTATVKIGDDDFTINGATEMYRDITDCIEVDEYGIATITIQNTGSGILAVNNIKLTGDATMTTVTEEDMDEAYALMSAPAQRADVINGVVTPVVEDDATEPGDDNISGDNSGTTESGSFLEQLIAMIIEIIMSLFNFLPVGEVM